MTLVSDRLWYELHLHDKNSCIYVLKMDFLITLWHFVTVVLLCQNIRFGSAQGYPVPFLGSNSRTETVMVWSLGSPAWIPSLWDLLGVGHLLLWHEVIPCEMETKCPSSPSMSDTG